MEHVNYAKLQDTLLNTKQFDKLKGFIHYRILSASFWFSLVLRRPLTSGLNKRQFSSFMT